MRERRPPSRPLRALGLRRVAVLVPESCAEGIRQFARELRARQRLGPAPVKPEWRAVSLSAELMVALEARARCAIRDTGASGGKRFHWTVTILGRPRPIAAGRTAERAEARLLAELALGAYVADGRELPGGGDDD
jgi:hypothetical protein